MILSRKLLKIIFLKVSLVRPCSYASMVFFQIDMKQAHCWLLSHNAFSDAALIHCGYTSIHNRVRNGWIFIRTEGLSSLEDKLNKPRQPQQALRMESRRSVELQKIINWKSGCNCPAEQNHKTAMSELRYFLTKKEMPKPLPLPAIAFFATTMLDHLRKIPCSESNPAQYRLMRRNVSTSSISRETYTRW